MRKFSQYALINVFCSIAWVLRTRLRIALLLNKNAHTYHCLNIVLGCRTQKMLLSTVSVKCLLTHGSCFTLKNLRHDDGACEIPSLSCLISLRRPQCHHTDTNSLLMHQRRQDKGITLNSVRELGRLTNEFYACALLLWLLNSPNPRRFYLVHRTLTCPMRAGTVRNLKW